MCLCVFSTSCPRFSDRRNITPLKTEKQACPPLSSKKIKEKDHFLMIHKCLLNLPFILLYLKTLLLEASI